MVTRPRYRGRRVHAQDGAVGGWGVFPSAGRVTPMAAAFTGRLAGWRARRYASALNRKGRQPLVGSIPRHGKWRQAR